MLINPKNISYFLNENFRYEYNNIIKIDENVLYTSKNKNSVLTALYTETLNIIKNDSLNFDTTSLVKCVEKLFNNNKIHSKLQCLIFDNSIFDEYAESKKDKINFYTINLDYKNDKLSISSNLYIIAKFIK